VFLQPDQAARRRSQPKQQSTARYTSFSCSDYTLGSVEVGMVDRHAVFVVPFFMAATLRFVSAAAQLPGVRLSIISQDPVEKLPAGLRPKVLGHWQVDNCFDPARLVVATRELSARFGAVDRLFGSLEQLQVPLAEASQALRLPGLSVDAANNFRDKNRMKNHLHAAGLPCARHLLASSAAEAREFCRQSGLPVVVKPPAGAGARNTFRLSSNDELRAWLRKDAPSVAQPVLLEEYLQGEEFSFDSIMIDGAVVRYPAIGRRHWRYSKMPGSSGACCCRAR
jgi:hypothetical protein